METTSTFYEVVDWSTTEPSSIRRRAYITIEPEMPSTNFVIEQLSKEKALSRISELLSDIQDLMFLLGYHP